MAESAQCSFDADKHEYRINGSVVPSVTQVIRIASDHSGIPAHVLEFARNRGIAVDEACGLYDMDDLDESVLHSDLVPYLDAWKAFKKDFCPEMVEIQQALYHPILGLAGTPDRRCIIGSRSRKRKTILDIKATAQIEKTVQLQLSGYNLLCNDWADDLLCVRLQKTGEYEIQYFKPDHASFLSFFGVYKWMRKHT
jgi:hypothetical protein